MPFKFSFSLRITKCASFSVERASGAGTRDPERNGQVKGTRAAVQLRVPPRLRVRSGKLQCVGGFRLPVCKASSSLPDSGTKALPQTEPAPSPRSRPGAAPLPAGGPGLSGAGRRTKRPAPSPTAGSQGEKAGRRGWSRRKGRGRRKGKAQPAGLGRTAPRGRGRRRGWAAAESREEGRILEAQDKQIVPLHVRGGGVGSGRRGLPSPPPRRLFVTVRPAKATLGAPARGRARRRRCTPEGRPIAAQRAREAREAERSLQRAHCPHSHGPEPATRRGRGADTFPELPASPARPGKLKNRSEEIRERIPSLGLGGGNCPFLPEKLSHWLRILPRAHPPSHLSLFHLPAALHSSALITQARKVGGERAGGEVEEPRCHQVEEEPSCVGGTLSARPGLPPPWASSPPTLPAAPPAGLARVSSGERSALAPRTRARSREHARA